MTTNTAAHPAAHTAANTALWSCFAFRDVEVMTAWLSAVGFVDHATYRDESGTVVHAEWIWPPGGGIMFGAEREDGGVHNPGGSAIYLITPEPDAAFDRAVAAGATVERPMEDQDYGGRGGTVTDPEGNSWSFGDYQPS